MPTEATRELVPAEHMPELGQTSSEIEPLTESVESEPTADEPPVEQPAADDSPTDRPPSDRREQARALREAGWSNKRIARHLGVHPSTVGRWFTVAHPTTETESDTTGDEP
jgi:DNA-binding NarL/FixJ family response regulator